MTQLIVLQPTPNQSLSANLDDIRYELTIKEAAGVMAVDITRNNQVIEQGARLVAGTPLIPYRYQEQGNFILTTENGQVPYYDQFGISQFLVYASASDLVTFRA